MRCWAGRGFRLRRWLEGIGDPICGSLTAMAVVGFEGGDAV